MLGKHCVVPARPHEPVICSSVLVMERVTVAEQYFVSITLDKSRMTPVITYAKLDKEGKNKEVEELQIE